MKRTRISSLTPGWSAIEAACNRPRRSVTINGMSRSSGKGEIVSHEKTSHHLIAEVPRRQSRIELLLTSVGDLADRSGQLDDSIFRWRPARTGIAFRARRRARGPVLAIGPTFRPLRKEGCTGRTTNYEVAQCEHCVLIIRATRQPYEAWFR